MCYQLERQFAITRSFISSILKSAFAVAVFCVLLEPALAQATPDGPAIHFDIPSQPLTSALDAYSALTGQEVFYDGALVLGRHSDGVMGTFSPEAALRILLSGTNLVPRATGPQRFSITQAPETAGNAHGLLAVSARNGAYERYFAEIQANLRQAFCRNPQTQPGGYQLVVKFWMGPSGVVQRSELIGSTGDQSRDSAFEAALETIKIGRPPPAGMPQPVTMAVLPGSGSTRECGPVAGKAD